jgi:hypothetical protein
MRLALLLIASVAFAATGDILAVRVVGSATGVADTESACNTASACTGWVAEIDVDNLSTGGTYALGIGANNSPASAKIVCTVTGDGYNTSAAFQDNTATRTVYGTHQLRNVYNAAYSAPYPSDETLVSTTLTLRVALSDVLYSGETASCDVGAAIYTQGGTPTNAATGVTATNSSTLTYAQARAIAAWSYPGWQRITSNTLTLRAVGFQRHAKDKRPLAAMKFTCSDAGAAHTATATVNDMTIDAAMPDAGGKVQEYIGNLDVTGFTQGSLVTCNFAAYPWVGDSTAVMDTSDGVNTMPTPLYAPQYYIMDAAGTYGTSAAVVDAATGNDTTCVAVSEATFNADPNSNAANSAPCATVKEAALKIRARNVLDTTHSDVSGSIYMKAGTYQYTGKTNSVTASSGTNYDSVWVTIQPFPGVARSAVIFDNYTASGNRAGASTVMQRIKGVTINFATGTPSVSGGKYVWFDGCHLTQTAGTALTVGTSGGVAYYTHNTIGVGGVVGAFTTASSSVYPTLIRGNDASQLTNTVNYFTAIGNLRAFPASGVTAGLWQSNASTVNATAPIFAYNMFVNSRITTGLTVAMLGSITDPIGGAFVQNVVTHALSSSGGLVNIGGASGTTNNLLAWHNIFLGERIFFAYNDSGSSFWLRTLWSERGQVYDCKGIKSDTFITRNAARVGNWGPYYGVGAASNMYAVTATSGTPVGAHEFHPEFGGLYSEMPPVAASIDLQASTEPPVAQTGDFNAASYLAFVDRQAWDGASAGTGNGDYHLASSSPLINMVPSGGAVLPYDMAGVARKNDGTGAAGAYEYVSAASSRKRVQVTSN